MILTSSISANVNLAIARAQGIREVLDQILPTRRFRSINSTILEFHLLDLYTTTKRAWSLFPPPKQQSLTLPYHERTTRNRTTPLPARN